MACFVTEATRKCQQNGIWKSQVLAGNKEYRVRNWRHSCWILHWIFSVIALFTVFRCHNILKKKKKAFWPRLSAYIVSCSKSESPYKMYSQLFHRLFGTSGSQSWIANAKVNFSQCSHWLTETLKSSLSALAWLARKKCFFSCVESTRNSLECIRVNFCLKNKQF